MSEKSYIAIDLKSFYASVECVERGLNPLEVNLVVADPTRTEKTICLAVSPALKAYGIPGRARLFEVVQSVKEINASRRFHSHKNKFTGSSYYASELKNNPDLELSYIVAPPQMAKYMEISTAIYNIYLKYVAPEDIHVYSVDEVFIDATRYLEAYKTTPRGLAMKMIADVLASTGITATAGLGTNMYLCKIAMDIVAKHIEPDKDGVRIAGLNEQSYRELLWQHRPLTDFWRIGKGYANKLEANGLYTMGDVARCSIDNEDLLYRLFGVNAELLIDHAWGWEPCEISDIKGYVPDNNSLSIGQVLKCPYSFEKGKLIVKEMTDALTLDLVAKGLVTDRIVLSVGYDIENLSRGRNADFSGEITTDGYGRKIPKSAHGSVNLGRLTASAKIITEAVTGLYDKIVDHRLTVRRMYVVAGRVVSEALAKDEEKFEQLNLFIDYEKEEAEADFLQKEKQLQQAVITLKNKYGKNAVVKAMNLEDGATAIERNGQVGGHKA